MPWTNYHTHCSFCDGNLSPETYISKAIETGMDGLGFSSHGPVPFQTSWNMDYARLKEYLAEISGLKVKYKSFIDIYLGLEIDYIQGYTNRSFYSKLNLDYSIGGVHYLKHFNDGSPFDFDHTAELFGQGLEGIFDGDIRKMVKFYFEQVNSMIVDLRPNIVAHLDLIKKFNRDSRFFDENEMWYKSMMLNSLELIKENGLIAEINTKARYSGLCNEFYLSEWALKECKKLQIPIVINADAHDPTLLTSMFEEAKQLLEKVGIREVMVLTGNGFKAIDVTDWKQKAAGL